MMNYKFILFFALIFNIQYVAFSQTCTLGISGDTKEVLVSTFQLSDFQVSLYDHLHEEVIKESDAIQAEIDVLLEGQPQSTQEELIALGKKYKVLKEKMLSVNYEAEKKMLEAFNEKQYIRYLALCKEAIRFPIRVEPTEYNVPKKE